MERENDKEYRLKLIADYRQWLDPYFRYIPWFLERKGKNQAKTYDGDNTSATISVPVYDSTLLNFIRGMQDTGLMNRNYPYVYSKYGLHSFEDEINRIEKCDLKDVDIIIGIISKYVLGGMSKGKLWTDAVEEGIFYYALVRIKQILDVWGEV
ncbi:MAG: hypothetical protein FWE14_12585 [Lachnospiraceae bacterium]|nr:hypothetical protein [Lachnospiraceae bacterium]